MSNNSAHDEIIRNLKNIYFTPDSEESEPATSPNVPTPSQTPIAAIGLSTGSPDLYKPVGESASKLTYPIGVAERIQLQPTKKEDNNKSFMEKQRFAENSGYKDLDIDKGNIIPAIDASGPTTLSDMLRNVDLRVETAKKAKSKRDDSVDSSPYALYEPIPGAERAKTLDTTKTTQGKDVSRARELHDKEAAVADFMDTLDKASDEIRQNPLSSLNPLSKSYNDLAALERSIVESGRKLFQSGANFTEFEIQNILKQVGPFFGPSVVKQPGAILNPEERVERLEKAQDLFMNKVNKHFESNGYRPKRVQVTGPDGTIIEVDAYEAPRANRLARDPKKWKEFIKDLK